MQRNTPTASARSAFTAVELHLLAEARANRSLAKPRTVDDALLHLARLGGHLRRNGPPGWMTLGRGYEKLLALHAGWQIAQETRGK